MNSIPPHVAPRPDPARGLGELTAEIVPPRAAPYPVNPAQTLDHRRFAPDQLLGRYTE